MIKFLKRLFFGKHYEVKKMIKNNSVPPLPQEELDLYEKYFNKVMNNSERIKAKNAFIEAIENPNENTDNVSAETKQKFAELMRGDKNARD